MNHFLIKESDEWGKKTFQTEKLFGKLFSNFSLALIICQKLVTMAPFFLQKSDYMSYILLAPERYWIANISPMAAANIKV